MSRPPRTRDNICLIWLSLCRLVLLTMWPFPYFPRPVIDEAGQVQDMGYDACAILFAQETHCLWLLYRLSLLVLGIEAGQACFSSCRSPAHRCPQDCHLREQCTEGGSPGCPASGPGHSCPSHMHRLLHVVTFLTSLVCVGVS